MEEQQQICQYHIQMATDIATIKERVIAIDNRINGSIDDVEHHISNSRGRNIAIVVTFLGMFTWLMTTAVSMGAYKKQIEINTQRWDLLIKDGKIESLKS